MTHLVMHNNKLQNLTLSPRCSILYNMQEAKQPKQQMLVLKEIHTSTSHIYFI